jgi:hypothetical protein
MFYVAIAVLGPFVIGFAFVADMVNSLGVL